MTGKVPIHGGTDAGPPVVYDFSTNAHPLGPPPTVLDAVLAADRQRYPDPSYTALRTRLSEWHGVTAARVLPTAGGAEAIRRLSLTALLASIQRVCVPQPGFGDYRAAAEALGITVVGYEDATTLVAAMDRPCLVWICDPCNPTGTTFSAGDWASVEAAQHRSGSRVVVDQAYEPLRLLGGSSLPPALADRLWRLVCPNKALGLTGVRAAYLLAPAEDEDGWRRRMETLASSWVLSAEGEALLRAWASDEVQAELADSHPLLREWGGVQRCRLASWGFQAEDASVANFWLARLPELGQDIRLEADLNLDLDLDLGADQRAIAKALAQSQAAAEAQTQAVPAPIAPLRTPPVTPTGLLAALRSHGIKLRDATSFQRPGWVRMSVQSPEAVDALVLALHQVLGPHHSSRTMGALAAAPGPDTTTDATDVNNGGGDRDIRPGPGPGPGPGPREDIS